MKLHRLLALAASCSLTHSCSGRTLIGTHPGMQWLHLSPDGRWLDAGSASVEGSSSWNSDTWRYDLWRGGHINLGYKFGYTWLSNGLVADVASTEAENLKTSTGMEGQAAPVISLSRPQATKPLRIYRDQMFARDPYNDVRLSQDKRHLLVYSRRWIRRFYVRTGRLLSRTKWPLVTSSDYVRGDVSCDGRWIVAIRYNPNLPSPNGQEQEQKTLVQLYGQDGRVQRDFPQREDELGDNVWITPTIFALTRRWSPKNNPDQPRTFTEFYDARTLKRLWVLSDRVVRERIQGEATWRSSWRSLGLIPQNNQIIVCGENIWTWRDARTGKITRQALRPTAWKLDRPFGQGVEVHGDSYYWFDSKGRIWRGRFHFLRSSRKNG